MVQSHPIKIELEICTMHTQDTQDHGHSQAQGLNSCFMETRLTHDVRMHTDACKALAAIWILDWQRRDPKNEENA